MSSLFGIMRISSSGLSCERLRMDIIANNIANANTIKTTDGSYFKRKSVVLQSKPDNSFIISQKKGLGLGGVEVTEIVDDTSPPELRYDPGNPEANKDGFVEMPNVNVLNEMVDMISATRAYEANITAVESVKHMIKKTIELANI